MGIHRVLHRFPGRFLTIMSVSCVLGALAAPAPIAAIPPAADCTVQGTVTDIRGASVPHAEIVALPGGTAVRAGQNGVFCLVVPGVIEELRVQADGFDTLELLAGHDFGPALPSLQVVLKPAGISEEITVTSATRTTKRLDDVPVRTEVIRPELISLSASRSLADAVEFTPGIRVENNCQNCNFAHIRLLGLQGPYTQILIDGQPVVSALAQVYGVEQIPAQMVDRIEVVKGGGSAIYGPGSVGGVVNVISKIPTRTAGFFSTRRDWISGRPNHSVTGAADWVSKDQETTLTLFGQSDRIPGLDFSGDGYTEVGERDLDALGGRFSHTLLDQGARLTLDFNRISEFRRGGNRLDLAPHEAEVAELADTSRTGFGAVWHHTPGTHFDYRIGISHASTRRDTYYGSGQDPNAYGESRNPLWVLDSQLNHFWGNHIVSWGTQFTSDQIEDSQPAYGRFHNETYRDLGLFIQHDWFFAPGWELIYGARVDRHSAIEDPIVSPRVALMWTPQPEFRIRTSWARGFLPPQVFDEDLHITQVGGEAQVIRNVAGLQPERSRSVMLGMEWKPVRRSNNGLLEVNLFDTRISDLFNTSFNDDPRTEEVEFTRFNFGRARVYGVEVNVGYAWNPTLELQVGMVEQRARYGDAEPDFGSFDFFRTPRRYGVATLLYRHPSRFDLFLGARYTGTMVLPHYAGYISEDRLETTPVHWTFDAGITKSVPVLSDSKLVFSAGVRNLNNFYQNDLDQGPNRDAGYVWGPRMPRTFYVGTSVEF